MEANLSSLATTLFLMFFGALGASYLPYHMAVKESHLHSMAALGGGLLLSSALSIVIPEGFHLFHASSTQHHDHDDHDHAHTGTPEGLAGLALVVGFLIMMFLDQLQVDHSHGHHHHTHSHKHKNSNTQHTTSTTTTNNKHTATSATASMSKIEKLATNTKYGYEDDLDGTSTHSEESLTSLPKPPLSSSIPLPHASSSPSLIASAQQQQSSSDASRAVAGLMIHCCADGLAMGSAALSGNATVNFAVGMAMILHKAPMAFGLSTFLLNARWPWSRARRTLVLFASIAPISTIITYTVLRIVPIFTTPVAVSLAILFSGGTFLYAATMHILPEIAENRGSGSGGCGGGRLNRDQLLALTLGCALPIVLSWGHHH